MIARRKRKLVAIVAALLAAVLATLSVDGFRWRAELIAMKALGRIDGLSWPQLMHMIEPGSSIYLDELRNVGNAHAVISNPYDSDDDSATGGRLFGVRCAICHGAEGTGADTAPRLVNRSLKVGDSDWSLYQTITEGIAERGMPSVGVSEREAWQIVAYVRRLRNDSIETKTRHPEVKPISVTSSRLVHSAAEPSNWLTYSGAYNSWRYSALDQITNANVADLRLAWALQLGTNAEYIETSPVVVDEVMYLSTPPGEVLAVDAATGKVFWHYTRSAPSRLLLCCGNVNRGVAVLNDRVFIGTIDAHLLALDARTGKLLWDTAVGDHRDGFSMTAAPLAVGDKIVVGVGGGDFGTRGFLDAYDAATGKRMWRFVTIPEPGQPGSETWSGDAWKTGGGATWVTGSFDPGLGLLYWGVGNPAPDFDGDVRPGDNLYTNSVIALHIDSGELAWHFQFTPHDEHDWDSNQVPVLVDLDVGGVRRPLMLWANRNGFYYVLDRSTGEFVRASAFVTQNWAERIDEKGRPVLLADSRPSAHGVLTWPGLSGGANWWSPSFNPRTSVIYVPFADAPKIFFKGDRIAGRSSELAAGRQYLGSVSLHTGDPMRAGVRALDARTGDVVWEYLRRDPQRDVGRIGGTLATAGNLVFVGDLTEFVAFDSDNGHELWRLNLGGQINASPMTFSAAGKQRVAIPAGNTLYVFGL